MTGWDTIVGHERITAALQRAADNDSPHHAYLLMGPAGIGKMTLARVFAKALVCTAQQRRPCAGCAACRQADAGTHLDLSVVGLEGSSQIITVSQIREIQRKLAYRQAGKRCRVVIIDDAGSMNVDSQNKLLKTLEEPPARTVLILCCLHPGLLLATVRSRCQKLMLAPVAAADLERWLLDNQDTVPQRASRAAAAARGVPGRAIELLDPDLDEARGQRIRALIGCLEGRREDIDAVLAAVQRNREESGITLDLLEELIRDAAVRATGAAVRPFHDEFTVTSGPLTQLGPARLAEMIDHVEVARGRLSRHVDSGALVEDVLLRVHGGIS